MMRTGKRLGFTLVELLIVVVILGVLASMSLPRFLNQSKRAETAEALQMIGAIQRVAIAYLDANGRQPLNLTQTSGSTAWESFGMRDPNVSRLWYYQVAIDGGTAELYAVYQADGFSGGSFGGAVTYMKFTIKSDGSPGAWSCAGTLQALLSSGVQIGCQF